MILGLKFILIKHRRSNNNKQRCHVCMNRRHRHPATQQKSFKRVKAPQTPRLFDSSSSSSSFSVFLSLNLYLSFSLYKVCVFFFSFSLPILSISSFDSQISQRYVYPNRDIVCFYFCLCVNFFFWFLFIPILSQTFPLFLRYCHQNPSSAIFSLYKAPIPPL